MAVSGRLYLGSLHGDERRIISITRIRSWTLSHCFSMARMCVTMVSAPIPCFGQNMQNHAGLFQACVHPWCIRRSLPHATVIDIRVSHECRSMRANSDDGPSQKVQRSWPCRWRNAGSKSGVPKRGSKYEATAGHAQCVPGGGFKI